MHERGRLTDEEYEKAIATRAHVRRTEAQPEKECLELVKRRRRLRRSQQPPPASTPPPPEPVAPEEEEAE